MFFVHYFVIIVVALRISVAASWLKEPSECGKRFKQRQDIKFFKIIQNGLGRYFFVRRYLLWHGEHPPNLVCIFNAVLARGVRPSSVTC